MNLVESALLVGVAGVLLGYLLIVRAGFRREFLWGVINLVPVVSLAFVLLYWRQARLGFLISLLGLLVVAGALYGGADARLERELARLGYPVEVPMPVQRPADTPVPNEELVRRIEEEIGEPLIMAEDNPYAVQRVQPLPPLGSFRVDAPAAAVERVWRDALEEELPQLIGERLRLEIGTGGTIREGTLSGVTAGSLFLQQTTRQGSVGFEYRLRDVVSMSVWDVEGAQPRLPEPDAGSEPEQDTAVDTAPEGDAPVPAGDG